MAKLHFIFLTVLFKVEANVLKGFKFGDNGIPWQYTPDMGHAEVNVSISKQFSFCVWFYADWVRHGMSFWFSLA